MSWILINISPSNIFLKIALHERYHQNCQAILAATGMTGLTYTHSGIPLDSMNGFIISCL